MSDGAGTPTELKKAWLEAQALGRFAPWLAGRAAAVLWFTPWPVPVSERAAARRERWLRNTQPVTLESSTGPLEGFAAGSGPAVLLVHGWGETAASLGAFVEPLVEAGYRVVGVNMPGHGPGRTRQTDAYELANAVEDVAREIGPLDAIVAHSFGAQATLLALARGLEANKVAFVAPAVQLSNALTGFQRLFSLPSSVLDALRQEIERRFGASVWTDLAGDQLAARLDMPAVVVHDRNDAQVPLAESETLVEAWSGARLHVTDGLGHVKIVSDPTVTAEITSWLSSTAGSTSLVREIAMFLESVS